MKIYTQNFVTSIYQTKPITKAKNNLQAVTQPKVEDNLNKVPYNYNNITFGSNVEVIAKMEKLAKSKNCKMDDLYKLFKELTATAQTNVNNLIKKFEKEGLKTDDYIKACIKQPSLFYHSPETIEKKVRELVGKFDKEGLNTKDYIKACIKTPSLFCHSPETIEKNVRELVGKFDKESLNTKDYIKACIKQPSLFCHSPEAIENNIRMLVGNFSKEGLNTKDYIKACIKQPTLFYQSPETIENNVRELVAKFDKEGLNTKDYIKACIKQPSLFCQSPETIAEHIRAYKYVEQNKGKHPTMKDIMKKNLSLSTSSIYLQGIVRPQIMQQSSELAKLGWAGLKPKLVEYFKEHPKAQFKITVLDNEMSGNFVKTIQEFSDKELGRTNAFVYEFVKN